MISSIGLLLKNYKRVYILPLILNLVFILIFTPISIYLFNKSRFITGYTYITLENIISYLSHPFTVFVLIITFFIIVFLIYFNVILSSILVDLTINKGECRICGILNYALNKTIKTLKLNSIIFILSFVFLLSFLYIIPFFSLNILLNNNLFINKKIVIYSFIGILFPLRWLYSVHYSIIDDCSFKNSIVKSNLLSKSKHVHDLLWILLSQFIVLILFAIFGFIGFKIIAFLYYNNLHSTNLKDTLVVYVILSSIVYILVSINTIYLLIGILFYHHKNVKNEEIKHIKYIPTDIRKNNNLLCILIIVLIILTIMINIVKKTNLFSNIEFINETKITSHRGASINKPENTYSSFEEAVKLDTDYIELDVRETLDKVLVVIHDDSLKRVGNLPIKISQSFYRDIKDIDVGSYVNPIYNKERIPLFKDVIKWAKENNVKLNIELKSNGNEINFVKNVINIIEYYNYKHNCVIASSNLALLNQCKKYDKSIKTVLIVYQINDKLEYYDFIDVYSVKYSYITEELVSNIHTKGKEIYAWTINSEDLIEEMNELNVDNIITDNVDLTKKVLMKNKKCSILEKSIDKYFTN